MEVTLRSARELQNIEEDEIRLTENEEQEEIDKEKKLNKIESLDRKVKSEVPKSSKLKREN